jgi:hypothetical protein
MLKGIKKVKSNLLTISSKNAPTTHDASPSEIFHQSVKLKRLRGEYAHDF